MSVRRTARALFCAASASALALALGCSSHATEIEPSATESAAVSTTTVTLFSATSLAKDASKTGVYTATVAGQITLRTSGSGDADLYVKKGSAASTTKHDCASEGSTATEQCAITVAVGDAIYWDVYAYAASTVTLTVDVPAATPPPPTTTTLAIFPTTSLAKGASKTGSWKSTVAGSVTFATSGSGDADLYVKKGSAASTTKYDCKSEGNTSAEHCALTVAVGDVVYWDVVAYAASSVKLDLTIPQSGGGGVTPVPLPPSFQYCTTSGACAASTSRILGCAEGQTTCAPSRSTTVAWTINGAPVSTMGINLFGTSTGVTLVVPADPHVYSYAPFAIANGISQMTLASDQALTVSYYGVAPVWGGTTTLGFTATSKAGAHGTSTLYKWPTYDLGLTHDALVTTIEKIASDEIATTGITPPSYQAFFMPSEMAVAGGIDAGLALGDGRVEINYGNPDWVASQTGGAPAITAHEFAHENTHTIFATIASKFTGDASCLNEGLADGLGNYLGYISDASLLSTVDGSDVTHACTALTEVHTRGKCVLWHLKSGGYFSAALFAKMFAPQHTYSFSSCDMSAAQTGNGYVVYLTESTGSDMSALVSSMGWPNAGSYAAAKAALGL